VAGSVSTVVHVLAERGLLADTTPVAEYWPEFAAHSKQTITVAHVLAHTAGVPQAPTGTTLAALADWEGMCARIADLPLL
jgi:CubicO group peptidase (beta-lactamase class C family)